MIHPPAEGAVDVLDHNGRKWSAAVQSQTKLRLIDSGARGMSGACVIKSRIRCDTTAVPTGIVNTGLFVSGRAITYPATAKTRPEAVECEKGM